MSGSRASVTPVTIVEDLPELCFPNRDRGGFDDRSRLRSPNHLKVRTKIGNYLVGGTRKDRSELRIVVQFVDADSDSPWHLVAYGSGFAFQPCRFRSVEDLLMVIRSAVPDFDRSHLVVRSDSHQSYIAYAGDMALSDSQLSALGLKNEAGPKS